MLQVTNHNELRDSELIDSIVLLFHGSQNNLWEKTTLMTLHLSLFISL